MIIKKERLSFIRETEFGCWSTKIPTTRILITRGCGRRMTSSSLSGLLVWVWVTVVRGLTTGCRSYCDPTCACSDGDIAIDTSVTTIGVWGTIGNTKTLGASSRMTQQLSDIESNKYYQIEFVGVPSAYDFSPGSEAVDGDYGNAALHGEPTISIKDDATTSGASNTLNIA